MTITGLINRIITPAFQVLHEVPVQLTHNSGLISITNQDIAIKRVERLITSTHSVQLRRTKDSSKH